MKRFDFVIIGAMVLIITLSSAFLFFKKGNGNTVIIKENNKTVYTGSLSVDKTVILTGNTVEIKKGAVRVTKADCHNQICKNHKEITDKGESIICLPNKVIAEIR